MKPNFEILNSPVKDLLFKFNDLCKQAGNPELKSWKKSKEELKARINANLKSASSIAIMRFNRTKCISKCEVGFGVCNKIDEHGYCEAYMNPSFQWNFMGTPCNLAPKEEQAEEKIFINPLKQSKRGE